MGRVIKYFLWAIGGFVTLFVLAAVALYIFFDPNDFREDISTSVRNQTGRDLTIEGDISLDIFPWLAVEVGKASLGNAPGFGDEPMASFEGASFSVRLLPAILRQEVVVGAAVIESLRLNLKADRHGVGNWSDLVSASAGGEADTTPASGGKLDVNSIEIIDAMIRYEDEASGENIVIDGLNLKVGRLQSDGSAVPFDAELRFDVQPAGLSGAITVDTVLAFDAVTGLLRLDDLSIDGAVAGIASIPMQMSLQTNSVEVRTTEQQITAQPIDLTMLEMHINVNVTPFSYEDSVAPRATIAIDAFSPRAVMKLFDVEAPETADPTALSRVSIDATAEITASAIELTDVAIKMDDTSFSGTLSIPTMSMGSYQFDLTGDTIDLARYMEPADASADTGSDAVAPLEIPTDLIKALNARGKFRLTRATLDKLIFQEIDVGLNSSNGKMRIFPITSKLFGGTYNGDVRIDVSGKSPVLSLNEKIKGVDLARLAKAMFDQDNVTGSIGGAFVLAGTGPDMDAIQRDLAGNLSIVLRNGSYQGTDIWYELRRARAILKGEQVPEAVLPAKTEFNSVRMTGVVADGILRSDDLFAELPFMQLTGGGQVDIPAATINYKLSARILERPEFLHDASPEELDEFTEAVIPLKITGPLASPSIKPDLEKLLQKQVEDELKDMLKDKLKGLFD